MEWTHVISSCWITRADNLCMTSQWKCWKCSISSPPFIIVATSVNASKKLWFWAWLNRDRLSCSFSPGFQKTCLEAHNAFRAFHDVLPLKWSSKLSRDAQKWADHLASIGGIHHDPKARGKDQGENLYYEIPADRPKRLCDYDENQADCLSCKDIMQLWYNEEENYDYKTGKAKKPGAVILHFTQLIWKASRELGMATAVSAKNGNMLVAVARYSPVGNWLGEFQENIPPPSL